MQVKSLQRALLLTSAVVGVGVGVTSVVLWRRMKSSVRVDMVATTAATSPTVVVTRVLVRRRVDAPGDEPGEVLQTQYLGQVQRRDDANNSAPSPSSSSQGLVTQVKRLPVAVKVTIFGALVAGFIVFNAWAVPMMVPKRAIPVFESLVSRATHGGVFIELGCGDGKAVVAAAKVFTEAHGYDRRQWLLRLARKNAANVHWHGGGGDWQAIVARADCVLVSMGADEIAAARALMRPGAMLLTQSDNGSFVVEAKV